MNYSKKMARYLQTADFRPVSGPGLLVKDLKQVRMYVNLYDHSIIGYDLPIGSRYLTGRYLTLHFATLEELELAFIYQTLRPPM